MNVKIDKTKGEYRFCRNVLFFPTVIPIGDQFIAFRPDKTSVRQS